MSELYWMMFFTGTSWCLIGEVIVACQKSARDMAQLHVTNLDLQWAANDFALHAFDRCEIDQLEGELCSIASGDKEVGVIFDAAKRMMATQKQAISSQPWPSRTCHMDNR